MLILDRDICPNKSSAIRFFSSTYSKESKLLRARNQLARLLHVYFFLSRSPLELDNVGALVCIYL